MLGAKFSLKSKTLLSETDLYFQPFFFEKNWPYSRYGVISHPSLRNYSHHLVQQLEKEGKKVSLIEFPSGEFYKTSATKQMLEETLFQEGFDRDTLLIGIGGGVVCDVVGFLASTYLRGVSFSLVPTTLLAMIDAAIGGKTAVNTVFGKNLLGSIYAPHSVFINPEYLSTLPIQEMRNGLAEIIKYALISDRDLFEKLENAKPELLTSQGAFLEEVIQSSCLKKVAIVEQDPWDSGLRRSLNFGHTVGHALEFLSHYELSHGQAIAIGMLVEGWLSQRVSSFQAEDHERVFALFKKWTFSLQLPKKLTKESFIQTMKRDKKAKDQNPRFVILKSLGEVESYEGVYCLEIQDSLLSEAFDWMKKAFSK